MSWLREVIIRVREGEPVPDGLTLKRVLGTYDEPAWSGTTTRRVYVVVCEKPRAASPAQPKGEPQDDLPTVDDVTGILKRAAQPKGEK